MRYSPFLIFVFLITSLASFSAKSDTLLIIERTGTLTFTHSITQHLQSFKFNTPIHIAYIDTFYSSLTQSEQKESANLFYKSIMMSSGIDENTPITRIISQGSASGLYLENTPSFFASAERIFTHILWEPKTGTLIPSDLDLKDSLNHLSTLFPNKSNVLLIGNYQTYSNYLTDIIIKENEKYALNIDIGKSDYTVSSIVNSIKMEKMSNTVALLTHPPETQKELQALSWLQQQNIPVLYMFANELDLFEHQTVGGLVVSPIKLASLIKKLINKEMLTVADQQVTVPLYHAAALTKFNLNPSIFSDDYKIIGRYKYSYEEVQLIIQFSLVTCVLFLLLYIAIGVKNRRLLKERTQLAEKTNQDKDKLMANISHELRTPLNAIHLAFEALNEATVSQSTNIISAGQRATQHLKSIINTILEFQKSSIGATQVDLNWVDKEHLLQALKIHQHHALNKSLYFEIHGLDELPNFVYSDEKLLMQILHNILSNSLKFTEKGGINVELFHTQDSLFIKIIDTGIGMAQSTLDELFIPFKQANSGINKKYQGTGLGMSLCKKLVSLLDGHMDIDSELGKGTSLSLKFPVLWQTDFNNSNKQVEAIGYLPLSVLVVEDDLLCRELLYFLLNDRVRTLHIAESAKDALTEVKAFDFDVVLTDIQMPEMDGIELFSQLRQQYPDLIVIAVTGNALESERQAYLNLGFNAIVTKPFEIDDIMHQLNSSNTLPQQ